LTPEYGWVAWVPPIFGLSRGRERK
jgi:hypothetical protein